MVRVTKLCLSEDSTFDDGFLPFGDGLLCFPIQVLSGQVMTNFWKTMCGQYTVEVGVSTKTE